MRRRYDVDPLESPLVATLLFGCVLVVATLFTAARVLVFAFVAPASHPRPELVGLLEVCGFMLGLAVVLGLSVAWTRRFLLARRSVRFRNLVTGALAGAGYAGGCYLVFEHDLPAGQSGALVLGFVFLGVWYAFSSGLNQVFKELGTNLRAR